MLNDVQAKLHLAAKSRLNRWVKPHARAKHLDAPEWLIKEWREGNKADIAALLAHHNFNKDRLWPPTDNWAESSYLKRI